MIGTLSTASQLAIGQVIPFQKCAHDHIHELNREAHPRMQSREEFERWLEAKMRNTSLQARSVITIPVVVHIVHDGEPVGIGSNISEAQVQSQIDVLNEDFRRVPGTNGDNNHPDGADVEIEFCLALVGPNGATLPEPGIDRINRNTLGFNTPPYSISYSQNTIQRDTYWDPNQYMNMWTIELADDFLGYAQLPEGSTLPDINVGVLPPHKDGVGITPTAFGRIGTASPPYNFGRTTTHEVGHWLGLAHIWGDGGCGIDDYCLDTPESSEPNYSCASRPTRCGSPDMYENYMDYTEDQCMNIFTQCQKSRMRTVMANAVRRTSLLNSTVCTGSGSPLVVFSSSQQYACQGSQIQFQDQSGAGVSSWDWSFPGGSPSSSSLPNPVITYNTPGVYPVELTVNNGSGTSSLVRTDYITITNPNNGIILLQDFENGFGDWTVSNPDRLKGWEIRTITGSMSGQYAASLQFFSYTQEGELDELISPNIDLSNYTNLSLSIDHAYRAFSIPSTDSLIVLASTDGGQSFPHVLWRVAENGSRNFSTNSQTGNNFDPGSDTDWCYGGTGYASCQEIDLKAFEGESQFQLKFLAVNGYGNNLYLDNIKLTGDCTPSLVGIEATPTDPKTNIYPNPTQGKIWVELPDEPVNISLMNYLGQSVQRWSLVGGGERTALNLGAVPAGTYILRIEGKDWVDIQKLIKQ